MKQEVKIQPWTGARPPSEEAIREFMAQQGLRPYQWSNGPGDTYSVHSHPYHKVIYVVRGSIMFGLPDVGMQVPLKAGDRLDLPAGVAHDAVVGDQGVICLEAHRE